MSELAGELRNRTNNDLIAWRYDPLSACLVDFKGRANVASVKNFQLVVSYPEVSGTLFHYHCIPLLVVWPVGGGNGGEFGVCASNGEGMMSFFVPNLIHVSLDHYKLFQYGLQSTLVDASSLRHMCGENGCPPQLGKVALAMRSHTCLSRRFPMFRVLCFSGADIADCIPSISALITSRFLYHASSGVACSTMLTKWWSYILGLGKDRYR